jgi:hypothetical protein
MGTTDYTSAERQRRYREQRERRIEELSSALKVAEDNLSDLELQYAEQNHRLALARAEIWRLRGILKDEGIDPLLNEAQYHIDM